MQALRYRILSRLTAVRHSGDTTLGLVTRLVSDYGRKYLLRYIIAIACMIAVAGMTAVSAYVMKYVVDSVFVHKNGAALSTVTAAIIGIFILKGISAYLAEVVVGEIGNSIVADAQTRMFNHLLRVPLSTFHTLSSSDLITRIAHNAQSVREMLHMLSMTFGRDLFTVVALVVTMIVLDPMLTAISLIGGPIVILSTRKMLARIKKAARGEIQNISGLINITRELAQGAQVVKSFGIEGRLRARMTLIVGSIERLSNRMLRIQATVNPLMETCAGFAIAAVVLYAGWRNLNFGETPGQFFAFITALLLCADPMRRLSRVHLNLAAATFGVRMMYQIIDTPAEFEEIDSRPPLKVREGRIALRDVNFSYYPNTPVAIGLTLEIPARKTTALVGVSGGGKSTIMALIQRFYVPQSGTIEIDGQNIGCVSLHSLRSSIAVVGQDAFLFEGTIIDNLRVGNEQATDEMCEQAARAAGAHEFIASLPKGYLTEVGELGARISGGQRQRIAIARAYLKDAPIILLDEPTSALDSKTEQTIQLGLRRLTEGRTTLVVAHRLSSILHADLIHVIEKGRVIESGTHDALLAAAGTYAHFFELQFRQRERSAESGDR